MIRILLFCLLTLPLVAADDTPCNAALKRVAAVRGAGVKVCIVTDRLVPNRTVIFAVLNFDESSENFGNLVVVLDAKFRTLAYLIPVVCHAGQYSLGLQPANGRYHLRLSSPLLAVLCPN